MSWFSFISLSFDWICSVFFVNFMGNFVSFRLFAIALGHFVNESGIIEYFLVNLLCLPNWLQYLVQDLFRLLEKESNPRVFKFFSSFLGFLIQNRYYEIRTITRQIVVYPVASTWIRMVINLRLILLHLSL